jgi:hypothetical protein
MADTLPKTMRVVGWRDPVRRLQANPVGVIVELWAKYFSNIYQNSTINLSNALLLLLNKKASF